MSRLAVFFTVLVCVIVAACLAAEQEQEAGLVDTAETRNLVRREASPGRKNGEKRERTRKSKTHTRKNKVCKCKKGDKQCKKKCRRYRKNKTSGKKASKKREKGKGTRKSNKNQIRQSNFQSCFSKIFKYTSKLKKARNIQNQAKRINGTKDQMKGKKDKKDDFNSTLNTLVTALGGNKTKPQCASSRANHTETLDTLDKCRGEIEAACVFSFNDSAMATHLQCYEDAKDFFDKVDECFTSSSSDAEGCSCFDSLSLDTLYDKVVACSTNDANKAALKEKKACKKKFAACKKAEDESVSLVDTCKEQPKCAGAGTKEEAEKQLKALTPLSDALKQTGFADALKKLNLDQGAGSDGDLSRLGSLGRTGDGAGCTKVLDNWKKFNSSGDKAVPGVSGGINETEINSTIDALDTLNNSPTLEADLGTCGSGRTVTVAIVQIRFYVFWCGWFQMQVVEIKITIITISFGIAGPATTAAPAATTAAPSGRNLKQMFARKSLFSQ